MTGLVCCAGGIRKCNRTVRLKPVEVRFRTLEFEPSVGELNSLGSDAENLII